VEKYHPAHKVKPGTAPQGNAARAGTGA